MPERFDSHIYLAPHLDDAVLACGGLIDRQTAHGQAVAVLTVFAGRPRTESLSAFARHMHAKWKVADGEAVQLRRREDEKACAILRSAPEHWDFLEAIYRQDASGRPLYASYEKLQGRLAPEDGGLADQIVSKILSWLRSRNNPGTPALYFPLGLSPHVDHQLLSQAGTTMQKLDHPCFFYEDWPLASLNAGPIPIEVSNAQCIATPIRMDIKLDALQCYQSQIPGLGGSSQRLKARFMRRPQERIWLAKSGAESKVSIPKRAQKPQRGGMLRLLRALRWSRLQDILPLGQGWCADIGCEEGRRRGVIENAGYRWLGLGIRPRVCGAHALIADAQDIPLVPESVDCVVLWQAQKYSNSLDPAFKEARRILKPGGSLCGSVSFLATREGLTPSILERQLRQHGFSDVELPPGLSGFALLLWNWLRRLGAGDILFSARK